MSRYAKPSRPQKPLNPQKLRDLALHYVGRYATTRAKLTAYLQRKVHERGWVEDAALPDLSELVADFDRLGYVDDMAFANSRARSLIQRGYGARRIAEDLRAKGIGESDSGEARELAASDSWLAADRFAKRKRIGPYAAEAASPEMQQKQLQAFLRAGHSFEVAKCFVRAAPGDVIEIAD